MNKQVIRIGLGVLAGAIGSKIIQSQKMKDLAVGAVAGGLKIKDDVDKAVEKVKENTDDIVAEAKVLKMEKDIEREEEKKEKDIEEVASEADLED